METIIDAHDISKTYYPGSVPVKALDGVHLHLERGAFAALVGPSGSGKTTLMNMIGGLDKPDTGHVIIGGVDITRLSNKKRVSFRLYHIGFVFQSFNLIPVLTAAENVELVLQLQHRPKNERKERVRLLFRQIGLESRMHSRPAQLSGGEQQRVAVARALATKPQFILADEPTANLDTKTADQLLDMMVRLNQEEGATFLFSTHDPRVIIRAKRVITLTDGKITSDTAVVSAHATSTKAI